MNQQEREEIGVLKAADYDFIIMLRITHWNDISGESQFDIPEMFGKLVLENGQWSKKDGGTRENVNLIECEELIRSKNF